MLVLPLVWMLLSIDNMCFSTPLISLLLFHPFLQPNSFHIFQRRNVIESLKYSSQLVIDCYYFLISFDNLHTFRDIQGFPGIFPHSSGWTKLSKCPYFHTFSTVNYSFIFQLETPLEKLKVYTSFLLPSCFSTFKSYSNSSNYSTFFETLL